jgi:hypothetical protein
MLRSALRPVLLAALLAMAPSADAEVAALGANGTMYRLLAGAASELLPPATAADAPVLVLEVRRADGQVARHLVPGTDGDDIESSLSLLVDDASGHVYLLWESWYGIAQSRLQLIGLAGDGSWTEPIEISASPYVRKNSTDLALTHDSFESDDDDEPATRQRTILHVAWIEEAEQGLRRPLYVPLLLVDGSYVGAGERVVLDALIAPPRATVSDAAPSAALLDALSVRHGVGGDSVIVAFADEETQAVATVEIQVVPAELSALADDLERLILQSGENPQADPTALRRIADGARPHLIDFGYRHSIQPALLPHLATEAAAFVAAQDPATGLDEIAAASRANLVDYGARLDRSGVRRIAAGARPHLIDFGARTDIGPPDLRVVRRHDLRLTVQSLRPAPETADQPVEILASPSGDELLVCWQDVESERVLYLESAGDDWSMVNALQLDEALSVEAALQLLRSRIDGR